MYLPCLDVPRASDQATCWTRAAHVMTIAKHSHVLTWQQPVALQPAQLVQFRQQVWFSPHSVTCSDGPTALQLLVTTCVTCGSTFMSKTSNAFGYWLGQLRWLTMTIVWLLPVTEWPLTGYWQWQSTGYWQWLTMTIEWLLPVTDSAHWLVFDSDPWLVTDSDWLTIDWLLTVTDSDHWLVADSAHLLITDSDPWLVTDSDWQWPLTGYLQWLTVTTDWLLTVTIDWLLTVPIDWLLTVTLDWLLTVTIDWLLTVTTDWLLTVTIDWLLTVTIDWLLTVTTDWGYWQWPSTRNTPTDDRNAEAAGQGNASELRQ